MRCVRMYICCELVPFPCTYVTINPISCQHVAFPHARLQECSLVHLSWYSFLMHINRIVVKGTEARDRLLKGANFVADLTKLTLGPKGGNVVLEKGLRITNDGYTIAREVTLPDEIEDLGQRVLKEACSKVNDQAGDGTTTAIVLAQAILKECLLYLPGGKVIGGASPFQLLKKLEEEKTLVLEKLKDRATKVASKEELVAVTKVSAEDDDLSQLIGGTQWDLGPEGSILVEESNDKECSIERIKGVRIDNGFGTSRVINNIEKQTLEVSSVPLVLTSHTIKDLKSLVPILDSFLASGKKEIAVVARAWTDEALRDVELNFKKNFIIWPLNCPYVDMNEVMKDLEAVSGATYYDSEGSVLEDMQLSDIGFAEKIVFGRYSGIITGRSDAETTKRIEDRVENLVKKYAGSESEFEKKSIQLRVAQLQNGFALLKVGANSDQERKYKKDKADDAVNAAKAALQEGVVRGGGLAFKEIAEELAVDAILRKVLPEIHKQIMANAGGDFEVEEWVKDPVKVLRVALTVASSVAGTFATSVGAVAVEFDKPTFVQKKD